MSIYESVIILREGEILVDVYQRQKEQSCSQKDVSKHLSLSQKNITLVPSHQSFAPEALSQTEPLGLYCTLRLGLLGKQKKNSSHRCRERGEKRLCNRSEQHNI